MRLIYWTTAWLAGIWLAARLELAAAFWLALAGSALLALLALRRRRWLVVALAAFFLPLGALRYGAWPQADEVASLADGRGLTLIGVVANDPQTRGAITQFQLRVNARWRDGVAEAMSGRVQVKARRGPEFGYGDLVRVGGRLSQPGEIDAFSYADHLARRAVFSVMTEAHVERLAGGYGNRLRRALLELRHAAAARIGRHLPEPEAGLLSGILLGDESDIDRTVYDAFARVGVAHVIAISGFNMTLLSGLLAFFLQWLGLGRWRLLWVLLLWMALYTALVGASPPVLRAALMSALLVVGYSLGRPTQIMSSLAASALLLTVINPTVLWDVGFQLSAGGVLGIGVCLGGRYWLPLAVDARRDRQVPWRRQPVSGALLQMMRSVLTVSLAASLFTAPIAAAHFGHFSPWWLLANLFVVPVQGLALGLGMLVTLVALLLPPLAPVGFWFVFLPLRWSVASARAFNEFPLPSLEFTLSPQVAGIWIALMLGVMFFSVAEPRRWRTSLGWLGQRWLFALVSATAFMLFLLLLLRWQDRPDGRLHLWLLDLGNQNGVLIQTPAGAQILIDGGRYPERLLTQLGDRLPFYDRRIEALILTQPDERDVAALTAVLRRYEIGLVAWNGQPLVSEALAELRDELAQHTPMALSAGESLRFDGEVTLTVLHPRQPPGPADEWHDGALALHLQYGDVSFLLSGDSSVDAQGQWLPRLAPVTVLQLPQHGARASLHEDLLERAAAQYYAVSGEADLLGYGMDADVIAALPAGRPLFRADERGVLHFRSDGRALELVGGG